MKAFLSWFVMNAILARLLFGMVLEIWVTAGKNPEILTIFLVPSMLVCIAEVIVSGIVVYPVVRKQIGA